jgi:uncharacterized protein YqeY
VNRRYLQDLACDAVTLIETIRTDRLVAMKERDELRKNLLGTLYAAATRESKTPDDASVVRTIRAFLKSLDETIAALGRRDSTAQQRERALLEAYLPAPLDADALRLSVAEIVSALPERSPRALGQVLAALKERHGAAIDMRQASAIAREVLG